MKDYPLSRVRSAIKQPLESLQIVFYVQLGEIHVCVWLGTIRNCSINILLGTFFIGCYHGGFFPGQRENISRHSTPVVMLIKSEQHAPHKLAPSLTPYARFVLWKWPARNHLTLFQNTVLHVPFSSKCAPHWPYISPSSPSYRTCCKTYYEDNLLSSGFNYTVTLLIETETSSHTNGHYSLDKDYFNVIGVLTLASKSGRLAPSRPIMRLMRNSKTEAERIIVYLLTVPSPQYTRMQTTDSRPKWIGTTWFNIWIT